MVAEGKPKLLETKEAHRSEGILPIKDDEIKWEGEAYIKW